MKQIGFEFWTLSHLFPEDGVKSRLQCWWSPCSALKAMVKKKKKYGPLLQKHYCTNMYTFSSCTFEVFLFYFAFNYRVRVEGQWSALQSQEADRKSLKPIVRIINSWLHWQNAPYEFPLLGLQHYLHKIISFGQFALCIIKELEVITCEQFHCSILYFNCHTPSLDQSEQHVTPSPLGLYLISLLAPVWLA